MIDPKLETSVSEIRNRPERLEERPSTDSKYSGTKMVNPIIVPTLQAAASVPIRTTGLARMLSGKKGSGAHNSRVANKTPVSYTHLRAHETDSYLVCRLL